MIKKLALLSGLTTYYLLSASAANATLDKYTPIDPTYFQPDIGILLNSALNFIMVIAALLVFIFLVWGGIDWISAAGDKGKTESARNKITGSIVGLIVLASSYAIMNLVLRLLGVNLDQLLDDIQPVR